MNSMPGSSYQPLNFHVIVEMWYKVLDLDLTTMNWGPEAVGNLRLPLSSHHSYWDLYPFKIFLNMTTCISYVSRRLLYWKVENHLRALKSCGEHWSPDFPWMEVVGWRGCTTTLDRGPDSSRGSVFIPLLMCFIWTSSQLLTWFWMFLSLPRFLCVCEFW